MYSGRNKVTRNRLIFTIYFYIIFSSPGFLEIFLWAPLLYFILIKGHLLMNYLVKVIVDYLSKVDHIIFVNLVLPVLLDLKSTVVKLSQVSYVKLTIFSDYWKLWVVHLLFIWHSKLIWVIFSNFQKHLRSVHYNSLAH